MNKKQGLLIGFAMMLLFTGIALATSTNLSASSGGKILSIITGSFSDRIILSIVTGLISGFLSTFIFWKFTLRNKPKIRIADCVAKVPHSSDPTKYTYKIKCCNMKKTRAMEIRAYIRLVKERRTSNGIESRKYRTIPLGRDFIFSLAPYSENKEELADCFNWNLRLNDEEFLKKLRDLRLVRASIKNFDEKKREKRVQLEDLLNHYDYLRINIFAKEEKGGIGDTFIKDFKIGDIKEGDYKPKSLEIG